VVVELVCGSRYGTGGSSLGCGPRVGSSFVLIPGVLEVSVVLMLHLSVLVVPVTRCLFLDPVVGSGVFGGSGAGSWVSVWIPVYVLELSRCRSRCWFLWF